MRKVKYYRIRLLLLSFEYREETETCQKGKRVAPDAFVLLALVLQTVDIVVATIALLHSYGFI